MIVVDETEPDGEIEPPFEPREVHIRRGQNVRDKFILEEEIGRGKFGTVYNCRERETGLRLAAKFVQAAKKADRVNVEREVEIMNSLRHPRLIQLYDAYDDGKKEICLLLELIEGGELFERVIDDDFILTERACAIFMRQICQGVEFIHHQSVVHLDMKPENILCLTKTGNRIKLIDFGLARRFDPSKKLQVLFGTPEFVAPEVVNFEQIGFGTDLWSVGIICYVLLSGLSPFMGETDVETMANVTIAKYDFDDEAFLDVSDEAKDFISKLLVKQMSKRMTASECLRHPWLQPRTPDQPTARPKVVESEDEESEEESEEESDGESESEEESSTPVTATAVEDVKVPIALPEVTSPFPAISSKPASPSSIQTPEPTVPATPPSPIPPVVPEVPVVPSSPVVPVVVPRAPVVPVAPVIAGKPDTPVVPAVPVTPLVPISPVPSVAPVAAAVPETVQVPEVVQPTAKVTSRSTTSEVLQLTKVNLREFVERWNSHPNSPYMCESPRKIISLLSPVNWSQMASRTSLTGMSPSPQCSWSGSPSDSPPFLSPPLSPTSRKRLEDLDTFCHYKVESKPLSKSNSFDMDVNDNQFPNRAPVDSNHRIARQPISSESSPSSSLMANNNAADLIGNSTQSSAKELNQVGGKRSSRLPSESESKAKHGGHNHNEDSVESAIERTTILLKSVQETLMRQMESGTAVRDRTGARVWSRRGSNSSVGQMGSPVAHPKNPGHGHGGQTCPTSQSMPAAPSITAVPAPFEPAKAEKKPTRPNTLDPNAGNASKRPPPKIPPPPPPVSVLGRWRGNQQTNSLAPSSAIPHQPPRSPSPRSPVLERWRNNQFTDNNSLDPNSAHSIHPPRSPPTPRTPPGAPVLDRWRTSNHQEATLHPNSAYPFSRPPPPKSPPRSPPVLDRWRNNNNNNNNNNMNHLNRQSPLEEWEVHQPVTARTMAAPKKHVVVSLSTSMPSSTNVSVTAPSSNSSEDSSGTPTPTPLTPLTPSAPFIDKKLPMTFKRNSAVIEH